MIDRCDECCLWNTQKTDICPECGEMLDLSIEGLCLLWKCRKCDYSVATTVNKLCFWDNKQFSKECYSKIDVCLFAEKIE